MIICAHKHNSRYLRRMTYMEEGEGGGNGHLQNREQEKTEKERFGDYF